MDQALNSGEILDALVGSSLRCLRSPELQTGTLGLLSHGEFRIHWGAFGFVVQIVLPSSEVLAVKVFKAKVPQRDSRYAVVADWLKGVDRAYMRHICEWVLNPEGIEVRGGLWPILTMPWVKGEELGEWVSKHVRNRERLWRLMLQWRQMLNELGQAQMAHGDLHNGNIIVSSQDDLMLVDYDGMFVPGLDGQKALELGAPGWKHPKRTEDDFNLHIDQFPALVGFVSFATGLWDPTMVENALATDGILFEKRDIDEPEKSESLTILRSADEPRLALLATRLTAWCKAPDPNAFTFEGCLRGIDLSYPIREKAKTAGKAASAPAAGPAMAPASVGTAGSAGASASAATRPGGAAAPAVLPRAGGRRASVLRLLGVGVLVAGAGIAIFALDRGGQGTGRTTRAAVAADSTLSVTSEPSGSLLFVDGILVGKTPWTRALDRGEHTLKLLGADGAVVGSKGVTVDTTAQEVAIPSNGEPLGALPSLWTGKFDGKAMSLTVQDQASPSELTITMRVALSSGEQAFALSGGVDPRDAMLKLSNDASGLLLRGRIALRNGRLGMGGTASWKDDPRAITWGATHDVP